MIVRQPRKPLEYDPWQVLKDSRSHTPDWRELKNSPYDEFHIFVTGNLRKFWPKNALLEGCHYYGTGISFHDNFIMKKTNIQSSDRAAQPEPLTFMLDKPDWSKLRSIGLLPNMTKHVEGDVYGVPLRKMAQLDRYEGNTDMVVRQKTWIKLMEPIQDGKRVKCFMWTIQTDEYSQAFTGAESSVCRASQRCDEDGGFLDTYYYA